MQALKNANERVKVASKVKQEQAVEGMWGPYY